MVYYQLMLIIKHINSEMDYQKYIIQKKELKMKIFKKNGQVEYKCDYCGKKFKTPGELRGHCISCSKKYREGKKK